jgi:hypothetical protein
VAPIDIRGAVREYVRVMAQQASVPVEDTEDTAVFAGGLAEATDGAMLNESGKGSAVGWEYDQNGKFQVGTHFRR